MEGQWEGGKGDRDRVDMKKYRDNYDDIDWSKGKETRQEKELVNLEDKQD